MIATLGSGITSYQNTGLAGNTNYSYTVKAYRGSIESNSSNTASATTQTCSTPPSAPTGVSGTDGTYTDKVRVSWVAPSGATSYQVYRNSSNSSSGASSIGSSSASPFDDTSAAAGTTYWYFVKACNAAGCSGYSASDGGYRAVALTDDNYEENDTLATAYDLSSLEQTWLSAINGYGKQADVDLYSIYVTPGYVRVLVDARFTHSQGDIDIALYDSAGNSLASSTGVSDNEYIDFIVPTGGAYYYIAVYYENRGNQYDLWWDDIQPGGVDAYIGGALKGSYLLTSGSSTRQNYAGIDGGPVKVLSTSGLPIVSSIRSAWTVGGVTTSSAQLMGLPNEQLSDKYVFPGYNNVTLNEQLRIANVDTSPTTVTVTIGGSVRGTYPLAAGAAVRINYPGLDSGPVVVQGTSGVKIISSIREAWAVNGVTKSFVQLMGLPATQLSNKYVFPGYNNVTLNEQLRIGNVDTVPSTVTVTIGGIPRGTYTLQPSEAVRVNYAGVDSGPVVVQGTAGVNIISSIREAWAVNGVTTSFFQMMGLPAGQLSNKYVFPAYDNVTLNDQLRIGNVDSVPTTVTVTIGGVQQGTYTLQPSEAVRINYAGVDGGPVVVQGTPNVKIISSIREAWAANGVTTSFTQLMGLPSGQLSATYLFPAYNNVTLNEQLRIGMP